jgi:hypothetical protein
VWLDGLLARADRQLIADVDGGHRHAQQVAQATDLAGLFRSPTRP